MIHFLKPIFIENKDENLCHIAPTTAKGYKIAENKMNTTNPANPIGMYKINMSIELNFEDQQMMIKGLNNMVSKFIGIIPETRLEK